MKERLTGAIILVALIVLLVPELLTGPIRTKPARVASLTGASAPAVRAGPTAGAQPSLRTYTLTLGAERPAHEGLTAPAAQPTERTGPEHAPAPGGGASPARASRLPQHSTGADSALQAAKSAAHPTVREARSSGSPGGWVVQLGSFASHENANRLARSLEHRGFRMSVSPARARARARVLWRVRAGPARDRARGLHLAARLRALGYRGELLPVK
ncbi:MAG: SPOR domain-containing protein [Steroidobacteraceae bacterium]